MLRCETSLPLGIDYKMLAAMQCIRSCCIMYLFNSKLHLQIQAPVQVHYQTPMPCNVNNVAVQCWLLPEQCRLYQSYLLVGASRNAHMPPSMLKTLKLALGRPPPPPYWPYSDLSATVVFVVLSLEDSPAVGL